MTAPLAVVDDVKCNEIARLLAGFAIPADEEDSRIEDLSVEQLSNFYFLLVGICHQTQSLAGQIDGQLHRGWDYLRLRLLQEARSEPDLLTPEFWKTLSAVDLTRIFASNTDGTMLTNIERRAEIIRDLGTVFKIRSISSIHEVYVEAGGRLLANGNGIVETLRSFLAYSDPVQKKTYFFLGLMQNTGSWKYFDGHNLGSPVDYHEVRGHLRLGTVQVSSGIREKLVRNQPVLEVEDVAIRSAVAEAILKVSATIGCTPMQLHYLFWNLFRNVCVRQKPLCSSVSANCSLPSRYSALIQAGKCPFRDICDSAEVPQPLIEHSFLTDWY